MNYKRLKLTVLYIAAWTGGLIACFLWVAVVMTAVGMLELPIGVGITLSIVILVAPIVIISSWQMAEED